MSEELHSLIIDWQSACREDDEDRILLEIDRRLKFLDWLEFHNNMKKHWENFTKEVE